MENEKQRLIEIAHLYYDRDWTQEKIAAEFNTSRSSISKSLTKAKKIGIVEVVVHGENLRPFQELEIKLKERLGLKEVCCLNTVGEENSIEAFAKTAGKFLSYKIVGANRVVISSGRGNYNIATNFSSATPLHHVTFIPASGGLFLDRWETQANVICERIAKNCGGKYLQLHVPIVVESLEAKEVLLKQHFVKNVFEYARKADLAIIGIGTSPEYHKLNEVYLHDLDESHKAIEESVAGDIAYNYFDDNGQIIDCEWNRQLMALSLDELKKIPEVIGVAYGEEKISGIYTAAKQKMIHTLITDEITAKKLLNYKS